VLLEWGVLFTKKVLSAKKLEPCKQLDTQCLGFRF
jgi:hypothetical protein